MTKTVRHTADYFKKLPDADPMADTPTEGQAAVPGEKAVKALIPQWADKFDGDDDAQKFPSLPEGEQWSHLTDKTEDADDSMLHGAIAMAQTCVDAATIDTVRERLLANDSTYGGRGMDYPWRF